ncbi:MAG: hypothetical protein HC875_41140 [Anaerolineales bacterium]|nr:hypothetical protein [Anaerolineales bacterium]
MLVGIDAVTNVSALEELVKLNNAYQGFEAKVFLDESRKSGLFHPKASHFHHNDGKSVLILGSGNLTTGGLQGNVEAYAVVSGTDEELASLSAWDHFLELHKEHILEINDRALEIARENQKRLQQRRKPRKPKEKEIIEVEEAEVGEDVGVEIHEAEPETEVLVAQVPKAGGRWRQIHYNKEVVDKFFRIEPQSSQRVQLFEVRSDGTIDEAEIRPLVYSIANKNYKIEVSARHGEAYPKNTPPVIVLKKIGTRQFNYVLLMPGDDGYAEMLNLTKSRPKLGKGHPRILTTFSEVKLDWPGCTL